MGVRDVAADLGAPGLVQPVASWFGDRFDRRRASQGFSDLLAAAGFVALAFARTPGQRQGHAAVTAVPESPVGGCGGGCGPQPRGTTTTCPGPTDRSRSAGTSGTFAGPLLGTAIAAATAPGAHPPTDQPYLAGAVVFSASTPCRSSRPRGPDKCTPGRFNDEHLDGQRARGSAPFRYAMRDRVLRAIPIGWSVPILGAGLILVAEIPYADAFGQERSATDC